MTLTERFRNGIWTMHEEVLTGEADVNFYRVAAGVYAWEDSISPSDYTAVKRGLALGVGVVPGAWVNILDTDGIDVHYRTQSGGPAGGIDPRGGDLLFELGAAGAGGTGTGRSGSLSCPPLSGTGERFGLAAMGLSTGDGNTAFGYSALASITSKDYSTAFGHEAGEFCTAEECTYVGYRAGRNNANNDEQATLIGCQAGENVTASFGVTAVGYLAAQNATGYATTCVGGYSGAGTGPGINNTFMGWGSGYNVTGYDNVAIGYSAMEAGAASSAVRNVVIGAMTGAMSLGSQSNNVIIGHDAGFAYINSDGVLIGKDAGYSLSGRRAVAIGRSALYGASGNDNVAVGYRAGASATSGYENTLVGYQSGASITTGFRNTLYGAETNVAGGTDNAVILGRGSGSTLLTGNYTLAVGFDAMTGAITGAYNIGIGNGTGANLTTGSDNVMLGSLAGNSLVGGDDNTIVGNNAATSVNSGTGNSIFGKSSSTSLTSGDNNCIFGNSCAATLTTGGANVVIGALADVSAIGVDTTVVIGGSAQGNTSSVSIGSNANASAANSVAIGRTAIAAFSSSIALGREATTTVANQFVAGSSSYPIADIYFGEGPTAVAAPAGYTFHGTDASGAGNAGGSINFIPGNGNGAGDAGEVNIFTGSTGTGALTRFGVYRARTPSTLALGVLVDSDALLLTAEGDNLGKKYALASDTATDNIAYRAWRSRGTLAAPTALQNGDDVLRINGQAFDGSNSQTTASILFGMVGAVAAGVAPQDIVFETGATNGASRTERYRISSTGQHTYNQVFGMDDSLPSITAAAGAATDWFFATQDAGGANNDGGSFYIKLGNGTGTGADGAFVVSRHQTTTISPEFQSQGVTTVGWFGDTSPAGANLNVCSAGGVPRIVGIASNGTLATPTTLNNNNQIFRITSTGYDGGVMQTVGSIQFECDGAPVASTSLPTRIVFETGATNTASRVERMRIASDGDIFFGNGETNGSPADALVSGTGGSGSDISGADLTIRGGLSTGNAVGGSVIFKASDIAGSGSTLNSAQWVAEVISDESDITSLATGEASRGFLKRYSVEVLTGSPGSYSVQVTDSGKVFTNKGSAGAVTFTLPAASPGLCYEFVVDAAQNLIINCTGSDQIQAGAAISTATTGDVRASTIGNVIRIMAIKATGEAAPEWYVMSAVGTWTVN